MVLLHLQDIATTSRTEIEDPRRKMSRLEADVREDGLATSVAKAVAASLGNQSNNLGE